MSIERFNQGFGKFGPMEQCSDGKWVKYSDHEQFCENLLDMFEEYKSSTNDLIDAYEPYFDKYYWTLFGLIGSIFVNSILLIQWLK